MTTKQMLRELAGSEVWTNAFGERFGERVCVGVKFSGLVKGGEQFFHTKKEMSDVWSDYMEQEGITREMVDLEREMGFEIH